MVSFFARFCFVALFTPPVFATGQIIRVKIGRSFGEVALAGPALEAKSQTGALLTQGSTLKIAKNDAGLTVNGKALSMPSVVVSSKDVIHVDGRKYRSPIEIKIDNGKDGQSLIILHPMDLEIYVAGIVANEVPRFWPLESLKAQAIAARTYAVWQKYRRLNESYHVDSSVLDQVYGGADSEHPEATRAAQETYGQVLTYDDKPVEAYFHSTCGGHTESAKEGWGRNVAYLPGNTCGFCTASKQYTWTYTLPRADLEKALASIAPGRIDQIQIATKSKMGRAKRLQIKTAKGSKSVSASDFRNAVGSTKVRSTWLTKISIGKKEATFEGRGYGHGVGMCQYGASGMAKQGHLAPAILAKYYPGAEIRQMY